MHQRIKFAARRASPAASSSPWAPSFCRRRPVGSFSLAPSSRPRRSPLSRLRDAPACSATVARRTGEAPTPGRSPHDVTGMDSRPVASRAAETFASQSAVAGGRTTLNTCTSRGTWAQFRRTAGGRMLRTSRRCAGICRSATSSLPDFARGRTCASRYAGRSSAARRTGTWSVTGRAPLAGRREHPPLKNTLRFLSMTLVGFHLLFHELWRRNRQPHGSPRRPHAIDSHTDSTGRSCSPDVDRGLHEIGGFTVSWGGDRAGESSWWRSSRTYGGRAVHTRSGSHDDNDGLDGGRAHVHPGQGEGSALGTGASSPETGILICDYHFKDYVENALFLGTGPLGVAGAGGDRRMAGRPSGRQ